MYMFDLPDDVLRKIYEYDSLKNDYQKKNNFRTRILFR